MTIPSIVFLTGWSITLVVYLATFWDAKRDVRGDIIISVLLLFWWVFLALATASVIIHFAVDGSNR